VNPGNVRPNVGAVRSRTVKRRAAAVAVGSVVALSVLTVAEVVARRLEPMRPSDAIAGHIAIEDRLVGWRLRPGYHGPGPDLPGVRLTYSVRINDEGFRGPDIPRAPHDVGLRLAALGDSVTFGFGVTEEETFTARVAAALADQGGGHVDWINAGVPGFTSFQGLRYAERVLAFRPQIVTILFGWNDGWRAPQSYADRTSLRHEIVDLSALLTLGHHLASELGHHAELKPSDGGANRYPYVPVRKFKSNLADIAAMVRAAGGVPILLTAPAAFGPNMPPDSYFQAKWMVPRNQLEPTRRLYADAVREVAAEQAIALVDCARLVPADPGLFLADGYHPNAIGQAAIADAIVAALRRGHIIERFWPHAAAPRRTLTSRASAP
jgi:lysophospholipase L1-like esterase